MGTAERAYSVSPRRREKITGPKPIEKRSTRTPIRFATAKCPSSWTNTRTPRATAKESTVKATDGIAIAIEPSGARERRVIVDENHGEKDAIQPVQDATVAGNNPAGVLGTEGALERRFREVPELREQTDHPAEGRRFARPEGRKEEHATQPRDEHRACHCSDGAFERLARADGRRELVAPDRPTGEVPPRVRPHGTEHSEHHPLPPVPSRAAQHDVRREEAKIEHAEECESEALDRAAEISTVPEREPEPRDQSQCQPCSPELGSPGRNASGNNDPPHDPDGALGLMLGQRHRKVLVQARRGDCQDEPHEQRCPPRRPPGRNERDDQPERRNGDRRSEEPGSQQLRFRAPQPCHALSSAASPRSTRPERAYAREQSRGSRKRQRAATGVWGHRRSAARAAREHRTGPQNQLAARSRSRSSRSRSS